jgi:hypothetical protein
MLKKSLLTSLLLMLVTYLAFAFIKMEFNPALWAETERITACVIWTIFLVPLLGIVNNVP